MGGFSSTHARLHPGTLGSRRVSEKALGGHCQALCYWGPTFLRECHAQASGESQSCLFSTYKTEAGSRENSPSPGAHAGATRDPNGLSLYQRGPFQQNSNSPSKRSTSHRVTPSPQQPCP